jgi:hypothetical protein
MTQAAKARTAACSCGQLKSTVVGEPVRVSVCHCLACQRRTGSVFGAQARFPAAAVMTCGESREYVRVGDSGSTVRFHFCPTCGSIVFYSLDAAPGYIAIPVGAFADPTFPPPKHSVYDDRMHSWVEMPPDVEHQA